MPDIRKPAGNRTASSGQFTKPGVKYPTPDTTNDFFIVERKTVDSKEQPIAYGTAHATAATAVLIEQKYESEDDGKKTRTRIYAAYGSAAQQDVYNAALSYAAESNAHQILIRSYTLPRAGYAPLAKGTADTLISAAKLIKEDAQPIESDNANLRVVRIYETLPGPWLPVTRYDDDLGSVQGRRRAVLNTSQSATLTATTKTTYETRDLSCIVSWEIEETWSNGTGSGTGNAAYPIGIADLYDPEKGAVQITTQLVVKAGTEVGTLVNASGVITETKYEPYNEFLLKRSVEIWVIASAPSLSGSQSDNDGIVATVTAQLKAQSGYTAPTPSATKSFDAERISEAVVKERVVDLGSVFDEKVVSAQKPDVIPERFRASVPSETTATVAAGTTAVMPTLGSTEIDKTIARTTAHKTKTTTTVRDNGALPSLSGQDYDPTFNLVIPYTEEVTASGANSGDLLTEIDPLSDDLDLVRTIDAQAAQDALDDFLVSFPTRTTLSLPPILKKVEVVWDTSSEEGDFSSDWGGFALSVAGSGSSLSGSERGEAKSSAGCMPSWNIQLEEVWAVNVPTTSHIFFLPYPVTEEQILAKVSALAWPIFKPKSYTLTAFGQSTSVTVDVSAAASASWNTDADGAIESESTDHTTGQGSSARVATTAVLAKIPPCLHGGFSVSSNQNQEINAHAEIGWIAYGRFPSLSVVKQRSVAAVGTADFYAAATSPADIPRTGKYLIDSKIELYQYGYVRIYAEVLDASKLA